MIPNNIPSPALGSTVLGAVSSGTPADFTAVNGLGHHDDDRSKNLVRSQYFSEHIRPQRCAPPFISMSGVRVFSPVISSSIAASLKRDFYTKRKGSQRMLLPLSMRVEEANPRASAGRWPYLCLFAA